jgi:probable F420-dependent oxidoreductase
MQLGITLGRLNPRAWEAAAVAADRAGFESVWTSDHVVLPIRLSGQLAGQDAEHTLNPATPLFDPTAYLAYLAGCTSRVRLGTCVYLLGLRHPFISARGFSTLDVLSGGRAICGVGAGWLTTEWEAMGIDPAERGTRLDEAIDTCRSLWSEAEVASDGRHFPFEPVAFEPKPVQPRGVPILVGGESNPALRRAASRGDGWLGMAHTPASARARITQLGELLARAGRGAEGFSITVITEAPSAAEIAAFAEAGVHRLIVSPWSSSRTAAADLQAYARSVSDYLAPPTDGGG